VRDHSGSVLRRAHLHDAIVAASGALFSSTPHVHLIWTTVTHARFDPTPVGNRRIQ
jgi:hypothetical protein